MVTAGLAASEPWRWALLIWPPIFVAAYLGLVTIFGILFILSIADED